MAEFTGVLFDEQPIPSFVKVVGVHHSILPTVSQTMLTVGGKHGAYDFGNVIGTRELSIDIMIIASEKNTLPELLEQLSTWLYYEEAKELVLGDNPNKRYIAKFTGDSTIKETLIYGEGTLTFVCSDPYIYGAEQEIVIPSNYNGSIIDIINEGSSPTYPKMTFEITKDLTHFTVVSGDEFVDIGSPFDIDDDVNHLVKPGSYVLRDALTTTNGWTTATSVQGGAVSGTFEVFEGSNFRQSGLNYGTGAGWHGASMVKPLIQDTQNFEALFHFEMNVAMDKKYIGSIKLKTKLQMRSGPSSKYQVKKTGQINEIYNVVSRSKTGWYKLSNGYYAPASTTYSTFTAAGDPYANRLGTMKMILKDIADDDIVTVTAKDTTVKAKLVQIEVKVKNGAYNYTILSKSLPTANTLFNGYVMVKRIGTKWTVQVYDRIPGYRSYKRLYNVTFADTRKRYQSKVRKCQLATMAYGTNLASYMEIQSVNVITRDRVPTVEETPVILEAGDILEIDNVTGDISKNDRPFFKYLNPTSTFIKLEKGYNGIVVQPSDGFVNGKISYEERNL